MNLPKIGNKYLYITKDDNRGNTFDQDIVIIVDVPTEYLKYDWANSKNIFWAKSEQGESADSAYWSDMSKCSLIPLNEAATILFQDNQ